MFSLCFHTSYFTKVDFANLTLEFPPYLNECI